MVEDPKAVLEKIIPIFDTIILSRTPVTRSPNKKVLYKWAGMSEASACWSFGIDFIQDIAKKYNLRIDAIGYGDDPPVATILEKLSPSLKLS